MPKSARNLFAKPAPWTESATLLVDVATGRKPADLVVRNGRWVNVHSGEVIPATDLAIVAGRFAYCGPDASHAIGEGTKVVDAGGRYLVPGLCDGHMHVESGMVTVTEFCRAVIPHGTTSMFVDPHEIANVLGLDGVRLMHDEALAMPINVHVQMPSCVPSAPGLENAGAALTVDDVREAMGWENIIGLGEVMNFPGVAANDPVMAGEIAATVRAGKTIGGHYASPDLGLPFHGYVAGGPEDDHEGTRAEDAIARVRQGMKAMLRLGSAWYDVAAQIKAVTEQGIDPRNFILCTDDSHSGTLVNDGHMDRVVRHAIAQGLKPVTAIQMATLNTAQHFRLEREIGSIAPGRLADFLIVSDLAGARDRRGLSRAAFGSPRTESWRSTSRPTTIRRGPRTPSSSARSWPPRISTSQRPRAPTRCGCGSSASSRTRRRRARSRPISASRTASSQWTAATTSARSRWSNAIAAPAAWSTVSCPASAICRTARSPRRWRMTATT